MKSIIVSQPRGGKKSLYIVYSTLYEKLPFKNIINIKLLEIIRLPLVNTLK